MSNFPTTLNGACRGEGYLRKWEVVFTVKLFGGGFFFFLRLPVLYRFIFKRISGRNVSEKPVAETITRHSSSNWLVLDFQVRFTDDVTLET